MINILKQNGHLISEIPDELKTYDICIAALQDYTNYEDKYIIEHIPEHIKTYKFYLDTIRYNSFILKDVPDKLKIFINKYF